MDNLNLVVANTHTNDSLKLQKENIPWIMAKR